MPRQQDPKQQPTNQKPSEQQSPAAGKRDRRVAEAKAEIKRYCY